MCIRDRGRLVQGLSVVDAYKLVGLAESNGEVRRLISQGGARLNDSPLSSPDYLITSADLNSQGFVKISSGKKRHALLRVT